MNQMAHEMQYMIVPLNITHTNINDILIYPVVFHIFILFIIINIYNES